MRLRISRILLLAVAAAAIAQRIDPALRRQYDDIMEREHQGQRISPEERQLMMQVYPKLVPPRDSWGLTALTDLGKGTYKGEQGGLYPGGENIMPAEHLKAGLAQAAQVVPRGRDGKPAPDGKIAVLSIGMSNTTMEYQTFMKRAVQEDGLDPHVVLVDGAQGGQSAVETSDARNHFWQVVDERLAAAGVTREQVQAIWMFQVIVAPFRPFPQDVHRLENLMVDTLHVADRRFANLKIAYLSSRVYAGYALVPQNPEPHSYESGWAPKWIIGNQIAGFPELNYDPARGLVRFPWVAWGPYMWADGTRGRADGLKWLREDFGAQDGMHPSEKGREKVAKMLLDFLKTDPTARPWFTGNGHLSAPPTPMLKGPGAAPTPEVSAGLQRIRAKFETGQPLTAEERQFVQAHRPGGNPQPGNTQALAERRAEYIKQHPPRPSTGLIPLTDLGTATYKGEQGGLYPGGVNAPPQAHVDAGARIAREVVPRDQDGRPAADGKIVFLSIGFSNPSIEFPAFIRRAAQEPDINPRMVMVNGCVGMRASSEQADPHSHYWNEVEQRLAAAGVSAQQVETLWIKEVIPGAEGFPEKARELANNLIATLHNVHDKFPNARLAYLSSRTYGGWTEAGGSPEPGAYETGFAVKWVVADQLGGKPELNYDDARGAVRAPWIEWGPYFWTDGVKGRKDGMVYLREDVREDGLHPSEKGSAKIAELMLRFFRNDPTSRGWFLK